MSDETTRLRALYEGIAMPLSAAQTDTTAIEISDAEGVYLGSVDIDDNPLYDASEATEAHAALIVSAVNALPGLLNALDAAERERDVLRAQLAPLLAVHDALVAAAALPGAGASPEAMVAAVRAQGARVLSRPLSR